MSQNLTPLQGAILKAIAEHGNGENLVGFIVVTEPANRSNINSTIFISPFIEGSNKSMAYCMCQILTEIGTFGSPVAFKSPTNPKRGIILTPF